ncbi:hypothetical protein D5086_029869 [Populus alba]|uniref:Uncharacterized protein n=1 Tax=Populus alba TaxID=43335 RepID=A0ACC4ALX5_POPAL
MTEMQLRQLFEPFGIVELVQLPLNLETGHCKAGNIALKESICFAAGNGTVRVHFWSDIWVENQSMRSLFPRLLSLSSKKDGWIADMGDLELTMEERTSY